jgi:hypothetical protein
MKGPGDFDPPDDPPECPECDGPMEVEPHRAECMECGHVEEDGPDEPDEPDEYADCDRSEAVHWGGMENGW